MTDEYDAIDPPTFDAATASFDNPPVVTEQAKDPEEDDYDPTSFASTNETFGQSLIPPAIPQTASQSTSRPSSTLSAPKPLVAGFILEDSDEEDTPNGVSNILQNAAVNGSAEEVDSGNTSQAQQIQIGSAPATGSTSAVLSAVETYGLNGSTPTPAPVHASFPTDVSTSVLVPPANGVQPASGSDQVTSTGTTAADPGKSSAKNQTTTIRRLAHDKVGHLEDRINDEPRADPEAFASLVAHYKEKNQLENVRKIYERWVTVFPTSVGRQP